MPRFSQDKAECGAFLYYTNDKPDLTLTQTRKMALRLMIPQMTVSAEQSFVIQIHGKMLSSLRVGDLGLLPPRCGFPTAANGKRPLPLSTGMSSASIFTVESEDSGQPI
jgi:hypothetical protein